MTVGDLKGWFPGNFRVLQGQLATGQYRPRPVLGVEIPKPGGGMRQLGIPTVIDRVVQQALLQALEPLLDPTFSESSFGFRRGRSAHQAIQRASGYISEGRCIVVDLDLEKFFDRVNHDILMSRVSRYVADKRILRWVNREKSAVAYMEERKFLGYRLLSGGRLGTAPKSLERAKDRIREITRRNRGDVKVREMIEELNNFLSGWITYFRFAEGKGHLESLGEWMRRKLRCVILKRLKRTKTVADFLIKLGVAQLQAWVLALSGKGWWRKAGSPPSQHAMNNEWFAKQKLINPVQWYETFKNDRNRRGTEQVCPVVWEGRTARNSPTRLMVWDFCETGVRESGVAPNQPIEIHKLTSQKQMFFGPISRF
jgi:hypothetical protein